LGRYPGTNGIQRVRTPQILRERGADSEFRPGIFNLRDFLPRDGASADDGSPGCAVSVLSLSSACRAQSDLDRYEAGLRSALTTAP